MKKYLLIFLAFFSCKKIDENGFRIYTIKKDKHRSGWRYNTTRSNNFNIEVIFDESAQYTTDDPLNQYDVNKLWGVSDCGNDHHENSIRFGWRWLNDSLEILWYKRQLGEFTFEKITSVNLNETINMSLSIKDDKYELTVNGVTKETSRACSMDYKKYKLYPYFGGDEKAPHDITIRIKENN
tara:strand:+ start:1357 stop:1902 length:546 start_codon:yes stop_codon:yes gene_type:complete